MSIRLLNFIFITLFLLLGGVHALSQSISGSSSSTVGKTETYSIRDDGITSYRWTASNGSVQSSSKSGITYRAVVYWHTAGSGEVNFYGNGDLMASKSVSVVGQCPVYVVVGGGVYCANLPLPMITLNGSSVGMNYQLFRDGQPDGPTVAGTSGSLSWSRADIGAYTVKAVSPGCNIDMAGKVHVQAASIAVGGAVSPALTNVYGAIPNVLLTLSGHTAGAYWGALQWQSNSDGTWTDIYGQNGATYTAQNLTTTEYRVKVSTWCLTTYSSTATVGVYPCSTTYRVEGGGQYCSTIPSITLNGSEVGIKYQLRRDGMNDGDELEGTGSSLSWSRTTAGEYTVVSVNPSAGCTLLMDGFATVSDTPTVGGNILPEATEIYSTSPVSVNLSLSGYTGSILRWQYNTGGDWLDIDNTSASFNATNTIPTHYRAVLKNGNCPEVFSSIALVAQLPIPVVSFSSATLSLGGNPIQLSTQAGYMWYQWTKNEIDIVGANTNTLAVSTPGIYAVKVRASATATVATSAAKLISASIDNQPKSNYTKITTLRQQGHSSMPDVFELSSNDFSQTVLYQDHLGRTRQTVAVQQSPLKKDIVQPVAYDAFGRVQVAYLPYAASSNEGIFRANALSNGGYANSEQFLFYKSANKVATSTKPFAVTYFSKSPTGQVVEQGAPGEDWQPRLGHTTRFRFRVNSSAAAAPAAIKNIRIWTTAGPTGAVYADNLLAVALRIDENGNESWTFKDKLGRVILTRVQLNETVENQVIDYLETYYVYDNRGNLVIQVPPKAVSKLNGGTAWSTTFRNEWCFFYLYDARNRLVEKWEPGAAPIFYAYDRFDRLVLTQNGILRSDSSKWSFVKYDYKGRPVITGVYKNATHTTRTAIQTTVLDPLYATGVWYEERGNDGANHGYTNQSFPMTHHNGTALRVFSVNYYDNHDFDNDGIADQSYTPQGMAGEASDFSSFGLPTGSKRLGANNGWLLNYVFYDKFGRVIQMRGNNHLSPALNDLTTNSYDFEGKLLQTKQYHSNGIAPVTLLRKMDYDHAGRLTRINQVIDNQPEVTVAQYEYNEIGQLVDKKLIGPDDSYLQSIDYTYTIRGWLKGINDTQLINNSMTNDNNDLFGLELAYNNIISGLNNQPEDNRYYNGTISASRWRLKIDGTAQFEDQKGYKYNYDKADRLKTAAYRGFKNAAWTHEQDVYTETMSYDNNGNILSLQRNTAKAGSSLFSVASEQMDNLTYTYATGSGNKLTKVEDAASMGGGFKNGSVATTEYTYNTSGSVTIDLNKGISKTLYNELGKPTEITFTDGRRVVYTYDGAGTKLTVKNYNRATLLSTTDYVGAFVYQNQVLDFFSSPEGRIVKKGTNYEYQFAIADNQGNTRLLYGNAFEGGNRLAAQAECTTTAGFTARLATVSAVTLAAETYVMATPSQTSGTPGIYPIGNVIAVAPGEKFTFKVKGYTEGSDAWLYLWGNKGNLIWRGSALPRGSGQETWVSNDIVIPADVTQLRVGVLWSAPVATSAIYLNKIGVYKHTDDDYTAGFEAAKRVGEQPQFANYNPTKIINSAVYARTGTSSYRLTGNSSVANEIIGPAKSMRVYTGDVVKLEVFAKYLPPSTNSSGVAAVIGMAINAAFGNVAGGSTEAAFQSINRMFGAGPMVGGAGLPTSNTSAPNAYLNYILFDDNYVPYDFGYDQVSEAGALPGGPDKMMLEAKVRKPGYLYIYVSNENPTVAEVYFDDLKIKHVKSPVLQYNEYYAYGLQTGNSWTREATTPNNFLGNSGTELNTTTSLYDLEYRNYDPALARMRQVDPLASKYASINPYNYSFNNPAAFTDPSGAEPANENYRYYREQSNQRVVDAGAFFRNTSFGAGVFRGGNPQSMFNTGWSPSSNSLMSVGGMTGAQYNQMREDAQALKNNTMSHQEYGAKYGERLNFWSVYDMDDNKYLYLDKSFYNLPGYQAAYMGGQGEEYKSQSLATQGNGSNDLIEQLNRYNDLGSAYADIPGLAFAITTKELYQDASRAYQYYGAIKGLERANTAFKFAGAATGVASIAFAGYLAADKYDKGTFNTSTVVDLGVSSLLVVGGIAAGTVSAPFVIAGGLIYGVARIAAGDQIDGWIDKNFDTKSYWYGK